MYASCLVEFDYNNKERKGILLERSNIHQPNESWLVMTFDGVRRFRYNAIQSGVTSCPIEHPEHTAFMNGLKNFHPVELVKYVEPVVAPIREKRALQ